jgi:hypothetical protein
MTATDPLWTLPELAHALAAVLARGGVVPADGRARELPDARTIRYYTTLGLLDRPAELRGRTAYYGRRHLAQLVAIKRLQSEGLTLAEVQERLAGLTPRALFALADLPSPAARSVPSASPAPPASPSKRPPRRFWEQPPAVRAVPPAAPAPAVAPAGVSVGVALADGVQLLFAPARPLRAADVAALHAAAAPLLAALAARGLCSPDSLAASLATPHAHATATSDEGDTP